MSQHKPTVFGIARELLRNFPEAEDRTQEAFLSLWQNYPHRIHPSSVGSWLRSVTRNLCLNHLVRHRARNPTFTETFANPETWLAHLEAPEPVENESLGDQETRRSLLKRALHQIAPHQREVLLLQHFEELSLGQIANRRALV